MEKSSLFHLLAKKRFVAACERLCGLEVKDVASENSREVADRVQPVWAKIGGRQIHRNIVRGKKARWEEVKSI